MTNKTIPTPPVRKPRRWLFRLTVILLVLLCLVLGLRLALAQSMPWLLNRTLDQFELEGTYEKLHLSLLTGEMELWHLQINGTDPNDSLVHLEYCRADVSIRSLLCKRLIIPRLDVDGLSVDLLRDTEGQWQGWSSLIDRLSHQTPQSTETSEPAPRDLQLEPPLELDAVRLQHTLIHIKDPSQTPPVDMQVQLNLRVSDLGSRRRPLKYTLGLTARPGMDFCVIEGEGTTKADRLQTHFNAAIRGLHSQPLTPYLKAIGLNSTSDNLEANLQGHLWLSLLEQDPNTAAPGIHAGLQLDQLRLAADQQVGLSLQDFNITIKQPQAQQVILEQAMLGSGTLNLHRTPDGKVRCLGLAAQPSHSMAPTTASAPQSTPSSLAWSVETIDVNNLTLALYDHSLSPTSSQQVTLQQLHIDPNTSNPSAPSSFQARIEAPGLIDHIETLGQIQLESTQLMAQLVTTAQGVTLKNLRPYLVPLGWEPTLNNGRFTASLTAQLASQADSTQRLDLAVTEVSLTDDTNLYHLDQLALTGLELAPGTITLDQLERTGERIIVSRSPEGLELLGLRYHPDIKTFDPNQWLATTLEKQDSTTPSPAEPSNVPTQSESKLQRVEIKRITAHDQQIIFLEQIPDSNEVQRLAGDINFSLDSLIVDFNSLTPWIRPGHCQGTVAIPGLIDNVTLAGTLGMQQHKLNADLAVEGKGIHGAALGRYTSLLGVIPTIKQGHFTGQLQGRIWPTSEALGLELDLEDVVWADANQPLLGLTEVHIQELQVGRHGLRVQAIDINEPMVHLRRDPNGLLAVAGLGLIPSESQPSPPSASSPQGSGTLHIDEFHVQDARIVWQDEAVQPSVELHAQVNALCKSLAWEPNAEPGSFRVTGQIPQVLESLTLSGTTQLSPTQQRVTLEVKAEGLQSSSVQAYFAQHSHPEWSQGQIQANMQAELQEQTDGSKQIQAAITDVIIQDVNQTWLTLPEAKVEISRFDPEQMQITVDQVHLDGVTAQLQRLPEAQLALLGWHLNPAPPAPPAPEPNVTDTVTSLNTPPVVPVIPSETPQSPRLLLKNLDLGIARISWQDLTLPDAEPLVLQNLHLANDRTVLFSDKLADANNPMILTLTGALSPIVESFECRAQCLPFASQQQADLTITLEGIQGAGLNRVLPQLKDTLDGGSLKQGRFFAQASLTTAMSRREFLDFDLSRPFALNLETRNLRLTEAGASTPLLGFDELHVEAPQIDLVQNRYHISRIEWTGPQARLHQTAEGLEVAGLTLKSDAQPEPASTTDVNQPAPTTLKKTSDLPDVAIDEILVSGLDLRYLDDTIEPQVLLPLNNFDFEWKGLCTRALTEAVPMQFNALLSSDTIPIAVDRAPSPDDPNVTIPVYEDLPLLQEVTATGRLTLGDKPQGWIKAGVNGLDLRAFRGLTQQSGVSIGNGILDANLDLRLKPNGKAPTSLGLVLTDLSLSESPDANLSKRLNLSAPLDVVLFAIKDPDGALRLKPRFELDRHGLSQKQISNAIFGAVGTLVTKAFVTSPLKPATAVGGLLGIGQQEDLQFDPVTLVYEPGTLVLNPEGHQQLEEMLQKLNQHKRLSLTIRHNLGTADLTTAQRLANPSLPDRKRLIQELQQRRQTLLVERKQLLDQAEVAYGLDSPQRSQAVTEELIHLHERLGLIDQSLDNLLETLRPGSEIAEKRRTRQGAIALGQGRLLHLEQWFAEAGIPIAGKSKRINTVPARFEKAPETELGTVTFTLLRQTK